MPVPKRDPFCFCGNLLENGFTEHTMNCPRYREKFFDEKPDPMKIIDRLWEDVRYLEGKNLIMKAVGRGALECLDVTELARPYLGSDPCKGCDPDVGFTCPECAYYNAVCDAKRKLEGAFSKPKYKSICKRMLDMPDRVDD